MYMIAQICPGLNANEIRIPYDKHHKVSSLVKSHQSMHMNHNILYIDLARPKSGAPGLVMGSWPAIWSHDTGQWIPCLTGVS